MLETIDIITRWYLALFFSMVAIFYTVRILGDRRRSQGVQLVHHGSPYERHWVSHTLFRLFRAAIWAVCVVRLFYPELDRWIVPCTSPSAVWLAVPGMLLLALGFCVAVTGHRTLGNNWRSGIDLNGDTQLVQNGLYGRSRNPMYIGVKIALVGFLLALPSGFSALCLVLGWLALDMQVKLEEAHLDQRHQDDYRDYMARVPRWL